MVAASATCAGCSKRDQRTAEFEREPGFCVNNSTKPKASKTAKLIPSAATRPLTNPTSPVDAAIAQWLEENGMAA